MASVGTKSPISPTLTTCYQPSVNYRKLISDVPGCRDTPDVSFDALDAWLLYHIAAFYPARPTVIDLAADATLGASIAFWGAQSEIRKVIAPRTGKERRSVKEWRKIFPQAAQELGLRRSKWSLPDNSIDLPGGWEEINRGLDRFSPLFFMLAVNNDEVDHVATRLTTIFAQCASAVVFVLPLGLIGSSQLLETIVAFAHTGSAYRVTALRESSPFCARSEVAVVYQRENTVLPDVFERLHQLLDGNFQFLNLLETATAAALREQELSQQVMYLENVIRDCRSALERQHTDLDAERGRYITDLETQQEEKSRYITDLETRLNYLEKEYMPWKDEYIANLETHLRNLGSSKFLRLGQALRRIIGVIRKR